MGHCCPQDTSTTHTNTKCHCSAENDPPPTSYLLYGGPVVVLTTEEQGSLQCTPSRFRAALSSNVTAPPTAAAAAKMAADVHNKGVTWDAPNGSLAPVDRFRNDRSESPTPGLVEGTEPAMFQHQYLTSLMLNQILTAMFQHQYLTSLILNQILTAMFQRLCCAGGSCGGAGVTLVSGEAVSS
ncbi:hypothetical protein NFI96_003262 [Prochilodus magdalenae]|nr:hypothetical protein NFI96_003262 [Prochilodus magdalenae]